MKLILHDLFWVLVIIAAIWLGFALVGHAQTKRPTSYTYAIHRLEEGRASPLSEVISFSCNTSGCFALVRYE